MTSLEAAGFGSTALTGFISYLGLILAQQPILQISIYKWILNSLSLLILCLIASIRTFWYEINESCCFQIKSYLKSFSNILYILCFFLIEQLKLSSFVLQPNSEVYYNQSKTDIYLIICYLTDTLLMIRRKNHNKQTSNNHNNNLSFQAFQNPHRSHKFNYQVNSFSLQNQSALNKSSLSINYNETLDYNIKNKENSDIKKKNQSILRKAFCYDKNFFQSDNESMQSNSNKYQTQLSAARNFVTKDRSPLQSSRSPLKQRSINQLSLIKRIEEETARKSDHVSFRQKKEQLRTNRTNLIETSKAFQEEQLQARYQELWNHNQNMKKNSFNHQKSALQHAVIESFSQFKHQNMIVNARPKVNSLIQADKQQRKYSTLKSERDSSLNSEGRGKKVTAHIPEPRKSHESWKDKNTSPNNRSNYCSEVGVQERKLSRNYNQHELPTPPNMKIGCKETSGDPDQKLRIVEDFSSKISLKIKQLKLSMEEMRLTKK